MILTGAEIQWGLNEGSIIITPFNEAQLNPNSYNLTLAEDLEFYNSPILDSKVRNDTTKVKIPDNGYILHPGRLYLASTVEKTESSDLVPIIYGRSSIGRLGLSVHSTSGFGDTGFKGNWTLGLSVIHPTKVYAGMKICQIAFYTVCGVTTEYSGKYQESAGVVSSRMHEDK